MAIYLIMLFLMNRSYFSEYLGSLGLCFYSYTDCRVLLWSHVYYQFFGYQVKYTEQHSFGPYFETMFILKLGSDLLIVLLPFLFFMIILC